MPKLDLDGLTPRRGSIYPEPYASRMAGRSSLRLGAAGGLSQFGVNLVTLEPGARSALRHWHENEDEFVMVTEGECVLIDDSGQTPMPAGACAAFPAGDGNGHCLVNQSGAVARFLVVGSRAPREVAHYPDDDMMVVIEDGRARFARADGSPLTAADGSNR